MRDPEQTRVMFRPPYGHWTEAMPPSSAVASDRVILWNVDSQDWNRKIDAAGMIGRVKKLMLLKRRGVVLFHDTKPKALAALPDVIRFTKLAGLTWVDCRQLEAAPAGEAPAPPPVQTPVSACVNRGLRYFRPSQGHCRGAPGTLSNVTGSDGPN